MEAAICSAPDVPTVPERQPTQLADAGSPVNMDDRKKFQRAIMAGLVTSPGNTLGNPSVAKPKLG